MVAAELQDRFRRRAVGEVRPALTLEDGGLALTDNYLKVQLRRPTARNRLVDIRIDSASGGRMTGEIIGSDYGSVT